MDPFDVLGISKNATQEEIKKAYRREAMKWHPDRSNNSSEAKARFQQAADAYRFLSEKYAGSRSDDFGSKSSEGYQYHGSKSEQSDNSSGFGYSRDDSEENFADTVFWEVMLDYAIKLAQNGMQEKQISNDLSLRGCPDRLAAVIAEKAFNIHAHYAANTSKKSKPGSGESTFKEDRLEAELQRAFIGRGNFLFSPRNTIEYYLVVFSEFRQTAKPNQLFKINANKRLLKILNFSILFFVLFALAINFLSDLSQYRYFSDLALLQLPIALLSLMFVWTIYRKLWIITLIFGLIYLVSLVFFNTYIPQALIHNDMSIVPTTVICYVPFIFIALFANYFYYRKAQKTIALANQLFEDHQAKIIWIKNRAGTSDTAAIIIILIVFSYLIYFGPRNAEFLNSINFSLLETSRSKNDAASQKAKLRLIDAGRFFEIGESHFNSSPPDYLKASMAYSVAVDNGSLLAAYKLGYMYYSGEGVKQNDLMALEYFELASQAPLAFQPHNLKLTTEYLAESYNNLGIIYQEGYGTKQDMKIAFDMYSKAAEFGSKNAKINLQTMRTRRTDTARKELAKPVYK